MYKKQVKLWTDTVSLPDWLKLYKSYYAFDNRVVRVDDVREKSKGYEIQMENNNGESLDRLDFYKLNIKQKRFILNEVADIWWNHLQFQHDILDDDAMFYHSDYHLGNLLYTGDAVRLIDPDSFFKRHVDFQSRYVGQFMDTFYFMLQNMLMEAK